MTGHPPAVLVAATFPVTALVLLILNVVSLLVRHQKEVVTVNILPAGARGVHLWQDIVLELVTTR